MFQARFLVSGFTFPDLWIFLGLNHELIGALGILGISCGLIFGQ